MDEARTGFYGRVDVYWPDGPIESYQLVKPSVAVGRSTGNDIVLDTTTVSRYHIALHFTEQQAQIEDLESVNGTYVDGIRLTANSPRTLRGGEEIQVGDVLLIFHSPADITLAIEDQETTRRITVSQPTYSVELDGPDMAVAPGAHVQATLQIENLGREAACYGVEIDGLPTGWTRVDRGEVEVLAGQQAQVVISFKPLRRSDSRPGDHAFTVRVRVHNALTQPEDEPALEVPAVLHVLPFSGFGMALAQERIAEDESFTLYVHNQGSAVLPLVVSGTDKTQALRFKLPNSKLQLAPGERRTLVGTIIPRQRRIVGKTREHEFALQVRSQDSSGFLVSVPGTYGETTLLPAWVPVVAVPLIALFTLLVVGALVLVLGNHQDNSTRAPVIQFFGINTPVISVGEAVHLTWDVTGSKAMTLAWDDDAGRQTVAFEPESTTYSLAFDQSGVYSLFLEARNGDLADTALVTVEVRPIIQALTLEVLDGTELVRNVQTNVRISWSVAGAHPFDTGYSIRIEGGNSGQVLAASPLDQVGTRDIAVLVEGEESLWRVTLYVEGRDEVITSLEQLLPVVYPSCELLVERTIVRSGPGTAYPALAAPLVSTTEGNLSLSPVARDPSGEWLRVLIGVGDSQSGWVSRADFTCLNFDPARLRVSSDYALLPTSTPTPSPTLVPTLPPSPALTPTLKPAQLPTVAPSRTPQPVSGTTTALPAAG